jgi:hypothetical protein
MPDKYSITELIPTDNPNQIGASLTFSGDPVYFEGQFLIQV